MSIFTPMDPATRGRFAPHYLAYLRQRDGEPSLARRTLSRREAIRAALSREPRPSLGAVRVDPVVFHRNLPRRVPEAGLDRATLWALALAKGNRAERFGVESKLDRYGFEKDGTADPITYVELQECYHTRLLLEVLALVGIECDVGLPSSALTRVGVKLIGQLPRAGLDVLALPFEAIGIAAFSAMRDEARELFSDAPALCARIDALLTEILVDEVGHVHFLRSRLSPARLGVARALLPFARRALFDDNEEVRLLLARRNMLDGFDEMDPDALVANAPDRLPPLAA